MKRVKYIVAGAMLFGISACHNQSLKYDASGLFEATEIVVSAKGNGELKWFDAEEGSLLEANNPLGLIDTTQLYLKKMQLKATMSAINHRKTNVSVQIAAIRQQIETQKKEQQRFTGLLQSNAANRKQLDDIEAQIDHVGRPK